MLSVATSRALVATLRGEAVVPLATRALRARADDGDEAAARALQHDDDLARGAALARAALAREQVLVTLPDGGALPLPEAERLLTLKEERGPYRPLRTALDQALREVRWFDDRQSVEPTLAGAARDFVRQTGDLALAALEVLDGASAAPIVDDQGLARALDLPDRVFHIDTALALLAAARGALGVALPSMRVPRALAGVVAHDERPKLGVFAGGARAARWTRTVEGGVAVLAHGLGTPPAVAGGLALGLMNRAPLERIGVGRRDAERVARLGAARAVLAARALAALVAASWDEALAMVTPRSVRPTLALRELLDVRAVGQELAGACEAALGAASAALALRDAWDEGFALHARAWREGADGDDDAPAAAWAAWVSDRL